MNPCWTHRVIVFVLLVFAVVDSKKDVKLVNNGYEGVVIAIHPGVPEDEGLIDAIKDMMVNASAVLFEATERRAYFKEITIVVPKTWTSESLHYAANETFLSADIRVSPADEEMKDSKHRPFTCCAEPCGHQRLFIQLTPDFIAAHENITDKFGPPGKNVVHEWAHYRWGVFDEYSAEEPYYNSLHKVEATRCSLEITGEWKDKDTDAECDPTSEGCIFKYDHNQTSDTNSSLMYAQYIDQITTFCDDDVHNTDAPNIQNRLCNYRSTWNVIKDSEDFQKGQLNGPSSTEINTDPNFTVVKHQPTRIVLVLDTSSSMTGSKIMDQKIAADLLIRSSVGGSFVGLVSFDSKARVLQNLTELKEGDGSKKGLMDKVPEKARGGAGFGWQGIQKAIEVLESYSGNPEGGQIFILTAGRPNSHDGEEIARKVLRKGIIVKAFFFGLVDTADGQRLANLSVASGGRWYYASASDASRSQLQNIFATSSRTTDGDFSTALVQISSRVLILEAGRTIRSEVALDSSIGIGTEFIFSWSQVEPDIEITPPNSNCVYSNIPKGTLTRCSGKDVIEHGTQTVRFSIPGIAEFGRWKYAITSTEQNIVTFSLTSCPSEANPITLESHVEEILGGAAALVTAKLFKNYIPVVGANVSAIISHPEMRKDETIQLLDNGAGADTLENDGVYARYFTNFGSPGRYSIQVIALKNGSEPDGVAKLPHSGDEVSDITGASITGDLQRITSSPGFAFIGCPSRSTTCRVYPPSRITDLSISQVDLENADAGVRLTFSAPGADLDSGTASRYDVRVTNESASTLLSNFDGQFPVNTSNANGFLQPKPAFEEEQFIVYLPPRWIGETAIRISIGIRSYDNEDNPSEVSNIASTIFFFEPPSYHQQGRVSIWIIVGASVGGGLVLILLIALLIYCRISGGSGDGQIRPEQ